MYRRVAVALFAVFALLAGSAASALAQSPKPDPAPAAQQQQQTSKGTTSGSTHSSPSPAPAAAPTKTYTPTPTYTPAPTTSSTSNPATTSTKHTVTHRAKPKAVAKKNARQAKPAAKKAKPAAPAPKPKPAPTPVVHSAPASVNLPTVPPAGDSGSSLSNRSVLLMAFVLVIGVGILALLARGLWRRVWWWRRYHESGPVGRPPRNHDAVVRAQTMVVDPWPDDARANGANGHEPDDEPATIVSRAAADDLYR